MQEKVLSFKNKPIFISKCSFFFFYLHDITAECKAGISKAYPFLFAFKQLIVVRGPALCVCKQAVITHSVTFNNPIPSIILSVSPDNESNKNTNLLFQQKYLRAVHRLLVAIWQFAGLMMLRVEVYIGVCLRRCAVKYKWKCTFLLQYPRGHKFGQHHIIEWGYLFFFWPAFLQI